MTTIIQILTAVALVLTIVIPCAAWYFGEHTKARFKKTLAELHFFFRHFAAGGGCDSGGRCFCTC